MSEIALNTKWVDAWVTRMGNYFGHTVLAVTGQKYDWGQALAREQYGEGWPTQTPDCPANEDVARAREWEAGEWPEWAVNPEPAP